MTRHWTDRLPGWPTERQWVTIGMFALTVLMLAMAHDDPTLWGVKLFEVVFQAVVLTGLLNMILAFHFAANKSDEDKTTNTGKAFDALKAQAESTGAGDGSAASAAADKVADAAVDKADEIKGEGNG